MCFMSQATAGQYGSALSYASWVALWLSLLASSLYVGLTAAWFAVEEYAMSCTSKLSSEIWLNLRVVRVLSRLAKVRRIVRKFVPTVGGMFLGVAITLIWQYNPTHRIHVLKDLGGGEYQIECRQYAQGCRLEICPNTPDPGFDDDDYAEVRYDEMPNGQGGRCISFEDERHTGWSAVPGHAKNREVTWTK